MSNLDPYPFSASTQKLQKLQSNFPVVGDKAIIDLINGLQITKNTIGYRQNRGWFNNLIANLDGSDQKRQLLLNGNLIEGQEALLNWVLELTSSLKISQFALEITQNSLLEARDAIRNQKQRLQEQEEAIIRKFNLLAEKMYKLEERFDTHVDLDHIIAAWASGKTYDKIPWPIQIALLAREAFSGSAMYRLELNEQKRYCELLVNKIITYGKGLPSNDFTLDDLLDKSWYELTKDDRELMAGLLEIRSVSQQRLSKLPHLFVIGTTLELAILPEKVRPNSPAQIALAICHNQIDDIAICTNSRKFITDIVEETAKDFLAMIPCRKTTTQARLPEQQEDNEKQEDNEDWF